MRYNITEIPKLFAFDLDGTLLDSKKKLSKENISALSEIASFGSIIAFATGRIRSSIEQYISLCSLPIATLSLNGAAVYMDHRHNGKKVYSSDLPSCFADTLIDYSIDKQITLNYYYNDSLFSVITSMSKKWIDLYIVQTSSQYKFVESFESFKGVSPSKIIMLGSPDLLDQQQSYFTKLWKDKVYICRTWDYYLEFLNPEANKGSGIKALSQAYGFDINQVIAFGDAENDIPMLETAGISVAVKNSNDKVKSRAKIISQWTNDENCIAQEWNTIKKSLQ